MPVTPKQLMISGTSHDSCVPLTCARIHKDDDVEHKGSAGTPTVHHTLV